MGWIWFYKEIVPFSGMVSVELFIVGITTFYKTASSKGLSCCVYIVYSNAIAALLLLLPLPFIFPSTKVPSSVKLPLFFWICTLSLSGLLGHIAGAKGIEYGSPTLSSAMSNLTPAFTFLLALMFRMEKIAISRRSTQAKIIGTITSIGGALLVVLYKGPTILSTSTMSLKCNLVGSPNSDWIIGGVLLATQYLLFSLWYIVQSQIMKICPTELLVSFMYTFCVSITTAPVCLITEKNLDTWRLKSHIEWLAVVFAGIFGQCYGVFVHSWGIRVKGPLYVATYKPLSILIAAFTGIIFLGDALHLGLVVGAVVISMGFYAVLWGKANEDIAFSNSAHSTLKTPFLPGQDKPIEDIKKMS